MGWITGCGEIKEKRIEGEPQFSSIHVVDNSRGKHAVPPVWGFIIVLLTCKEAELTGRGRSMLGL